MKKIWVTGSKGQLGTEILLQKELVSTARFLFTDIEELDLCDDKKVKEFMLSNKPDIVINCAGYTAVDKAEEDEENAFRLNMNVPAMLSELSGESGSKFIHISTDYVFDGELNRPYTEEDNPNPQSVYGTSKLAGEKEVLKNNASLIIRTAWLYSAHGHNFMKTILRLGKERDSIGVVFDQVGSPTSAADLANAILMICNKLITEEKDFGGIFHYSNEGVCSWYDFALQIKQIAKLPFRINPITTDQYPLPAKRPVYSVFNKSKIKSVFNLEIPYWADSLKECLQKL
jgi:dTDP-4-dehydrorhamnose reductase